MKIAIMGTGGVGGLYAALFARAGHEVTCIARGAHLQAISRNGLQVDSSRYGTFVQKVGATGDPKGQGVVDLLLFCVKSYDTESAAEVAKPLVGPDTTVVSLQNGVDNEPKLSRVFSSGHVLGGLTYVYSVIASPGQIRQVGAVCRIEVGEVEGELSRPEPSGAVKRLFEAAGVDATASANVLVAKWQKLVVLCAHNTLTALTREPIGRILACAPTRELVVGLMEEAAAVARAGGVAVPPSCVADQLRFLEGLDPQTRSSMYHDREAGRRLELEALAGQIVRRGRALGMSVPLNTAVYAALAPSANGAAGG